jgi:hypothetical protein
VNLISDNMNCNSDLSIVFQKVLIVIQICKMYVFQKVLIVIQNGKFNFRKRCL